MKLLLVDAGKHCQRTDLMQMLPKTKKIILVKQYRGVRVEQGSTPYSFDVINEAMLTMLSDQQKESSRKEYYFSPAARIS